MQMKRLKKALSLLLCMVLIVAMALITTGCSDNAGSKTAETTAEAVPEASAEAVTVLGEGSKMFDFSVVDADGKETWFEIHTDETTVGAALMENGLLEGEDGPYGLYVKVVNGISADYDKDKVYWAFYVNDAYGATGVDQTEIQEGEIYSFRIAK